MGSLSEIQAHPPIGAPQRDNALLTQALRTLVRDKKSGQTIVLKGQGWASGCSSHIVRDPEPNPGNL